MTKNSSTATSLFIVPTPIGNRGDMTLRALDVLREVDVVLAEDTRVTGKLLASFDIRARLERCDENVIAQRSPALVERMRKGETFAFCSDAGMPGVSDPGVVLVDAVRQAGLGVEVLPGASAVPVALVAAGFPGTAFYFGGFLPRKEKQRIELFERLKDLDAALIFYESPHRVVASLEAMARVFGSRRVALCRELTKVHEEVLRLPAAELASELAARDAIKGEIALVVEPPSADDGAATVSLAENDELKERIRAELADGKRKSEIAKELSRELGVPKNELYDLILSL
ncbi:MAG: 16S rRNA (cytidine(1402)-2'-O)-methyltransferase [Coriobacteriales bacterium]|jgi:16S rRNA (cytidine1402-2'-O)-methyltransferase